MKDFALDHIDISYQGQMRGTLNLHAEASYNTHATGNTPVVDLPSLVKKYAHKSESVAVKLTLDAGSDGTIANTDGTDTAWVGASTGMTH